MSVCRDMLRWSPKRVAVFRALALGDLLCAVPALRALRQAWPDADVTLIGLPWAAEFCLRFPKYIDRFVEFPGYPGLPEREPLVQRIPEFLNQMQREEFDLAVQLHGSGTIVNSLVTLFGARQTAGFFPPGHFCPNRTTFLPWPEHGLEIHRLLALLDFLGLPQAGDELELPLNAKDGMALDTVFPRDRFNRRYVVIHPGASTPARRWPAEYFAAVADRLAEDGLQIVVTGVASERDIVAQITQTMERPAINLCGQTDLGTLGTLVSQAELVVCNDTSLSHVAAAVKAPSVVISTGDNPARWAPIDRRLHRVLCRKCGVLPSDVLAEAYSFVAGHVHDRFHEIAPRHLLSA